MFSNLLDKLNKQYYFYSEYWQIIVRDFGYLALIVLAFLFIDVAYMGYKGSTIERIISSRSPALMSDFVMFVLNHFSVLTILAVVITFDVPFLISEKIKGTLALNFGQSWGPTVHFILFFLVLDFFNYWQHRLLHEIPGLWEIHKFHHSAPHMNFVTVFREHPLDTALNAITASFAAVITGLPVESYPKFIMLAVAYGLVKHSRFPMRWGWFGKYVLQSPVDHWIHHSPEKEHWDKNYANNLAIWDHVFGTYYKGEKVNDKIGLPGDYLAHNGLLYNLGLCYFQFLKNIIMLTVSPRKFIADYYKAKE